MSSGSNTPSNQTDFFAATGTADEKPVFTEICNALYERELMYLAHSGPDHTTQLKRRLSALPQRIQRAAHYLARHATPLSVDSHNGSWQYKQTGKCPSGKLTPEQISQWFSLHAAYGLVVPIHVKELDREHIELDSIDRVQFENQTLHTNKCGWFNFDGESLQDKAKMQLHLLKPTKTTMAAACCGHSWNHKGRVLPRSLTLREMLLSTTINWKHFKIQPPQV